MKKRWMMDIDYHDLCWAGDGSARQLESLFDHMASAGFAGGIIDCFFEGKAMYHSKRFPIFKNEARHPKTDALVERLGEFDLLTKAFDLGRRYGLKIYPYVRLTDDAYTPLAADPLFIENPHFWYETRCGCYQLTGVPCFNFPEVRELFLRRCRDLADHGAEGFFFSTCRSHASILVPYFGKEGWDIWGFNQPVADEYQRRYGVDVRKTDAVVASMSDEPRLMGYRVLDFQGTHPYEESGLRKILGEGFELFLRTVRREFPSAYIGLEMNASAVDPGSNFPHNLFVMDMKTMTRDHIIDEWMPSDNWRNAGERLEDLPVKFPYIRDNEVLFGAWLNDVVTSDGGGTSPPSVHEIAKYLERFAKSSLDRAMIHEALMLLQHPAAEEIWKLLRITS